MVTKARLKDGAQAARIMSAMAEVGINVAQFSVGSPSLDEVFMAITGRPAESAPEEAKR